MTPDDPRHGTPAGEHAHRRDDEDLCEPCVIASRRRRKFDHFRSHRGYVPHIRFGEVAYSIVASRNGTMLAERMGVGSQFVTKLRRGGPDRMVHHNTVRRVLAAADLPSTIGTQRRLRALTALGWSMAAVARETGIDVDTLKRVRRRDAVFIRAEVIEAVAVAYEQLSMAVPLMPMVERNKREAIANGWLAPLAWDDIDDPNERPRRGSNYASSADLDPVVVERALAGEHMKLTRAERSEVVKRARALGWSEEEIQLRTGIAKATDKTRFGDHLPDCGCKPGTASNGWIEKRAAKCSRDSEAVAA